MRLINRLYQIIDVFLTRSKQNYLIKSVFVLFILFNPTLYADKLSDSVAQLDKISAGLKKLEKDIANDQISRKKLQAELVILDQETNKLHKELAKFEQRHDSIKKSLNQLQQEKVSLESQFVDQNDRLRRQIRLAYISNQQPVWRDLVNNVGIQQVGVRKQMYAYINNARLAEIQNLKDLVSNLRQTKQNLSKQQQELTDLLALNKEQQTVLKQARKQKDQAQTALITRLADSEARFKEEQRKQKKIRALIKELSKSVPATTPGSFRKAKGGLLWPVRGEILNRFGRVKGNNTEVTWEGVATAAARGSEIRAIFNGQVIFADYLQGYGWLLILDHGDEYMSLYAHAETLIKNVGDRVASNEVIGLVGDSGNVTTPTMYFEIRRQGAPVNPQVWCKPANLAYAN